MLKIITDPDDRNPNVMSNSVLRRPLLALSPRSHTSFGYLKTEESAGKLSKTKYLL